MNEIKTIEQLKKENEELRHKLTEAEETLTAIRNGMVDAVVVSGKQGDQVFTLKGADYAYRILIETMNEGAATFTSDHTMMYCNQQLSNLLHIPCNHIIGKTIDEFISPEDIKTFQSIISQGFQDKVTGEITLIRKDGKKIPVLLSCNPISIDFPGACVVFTDLTELKSTQRKLKKAHDDLEKKVIQRTQDVVRKSLELAAANKELEAFSYSVSHDLRAPLRSIDGFSQALLEDYGTTLDENGKEYLQRVRKSAQRMERLIDDMLRLSRLTRVEMTMQIVDLSQIADSIIKDLKKTEPERKIKFITEKKLIAEGDANLLRTLLENLLGNAWKFTKKRKQAEIEFGKTQDDEETVFFIRDNGAGFNIKYVDKLFIPFQRLHDEADYPGTGIGLGIVQRIIHRHGGRIWADAEENKGATFYFTLEGKINE